MGDKQSLRTLLGGKFVFKKLPDGSLCKSVVVCTFCHKEFSYHRSNSSLRYHLNAKHAAASTDAGANVSCGPRDKRKRRNQTTINQKTELTCKSTADKLTNSLAKWIAVDCRPLSLLQDKGLENALQIALSDPSYELPCKRTITSKIQQLHDDEKQTNEGLLIKTECVVQTGDHLTTVRNSNYVRQVK